MKTELPLVSDEMKNYFSDLLGKNLATIYLQKISSPMEDYTLHIFEDLSATDEILEKFYANQFNAYVHSSFPNLIISSPKGYFHIESTDDQKEIVVENRAAEMIYQGSDVFVPGVKRANKVKIGDLVKVVNQNDIHVANGKSLMKHHDILKEEHGIAAKNMISPYKVPGVEQLALQHHPVYFQSFPAFLSCINLNPKPDEKILDSCAAPGNKTIHLSELSNRKGKIIAVDRSEKRMKKLEEKLVKFNLKNIKTVVGDITKISKKWTIKFDKILIDPPCTSLGLRPRLVIECNKRNILSASQYQKSILYSCNQLLKDGGSMIYSTCTVTKEENEEIIDYAVKILGMKVVEQDEVFSNIQSLVKGKEYPIQRFIPGKHNTLGYSITKLQK